MLYHVPYRVISVNKKLYSKFLGKYTENIQIIDIININISIMLRRTSIGPSLPALGGLSCECMRKYSSDIF